MASSQDHYKTLGIPRGADAEEIRKAYRKLARKFHPDLNPGDKSAEDRFKNVQAAYDILSDDKKRQVYDQYGFYSDAAFKDGGGPRPGAGMGFGGFDFSDFFSGAGGDPSAGRGPGTAGGPAGAGSGFGGGFRDLFGQFFGGGGREETPQSSRGADLEYSLNVDFWRAVRGTAVRLAVNRRDACSTCNGSGSGGGGQVVCPQCNGQGNVTQAAGAMRFNMTCPRCAGSGRLRNACAACHGEGVVERSETVETRLPAGVQSGDRLRVPGKGNAGTVGGAAGDLYITVRVEPHKLFQRKGDDIVIQAPVAVWEASLGAKIEVPTIDGRALLKIPQGTQDGQRFRLREKGVYNARKDKRGDQIVEISVQAPAPRDERTREILREMARLHPEDPRAALWSQVE